MTTTTTNPNEMLQAIAKTHLGIETLETRRSDRLDFHDVAVWGVKAALEAAYRAGAGEVLVAAEALLAAKDNKMETPVEWRALRHAVKRANTNK